MFLPWMAKQTIKQFFKLCFIMICNSSEFLLPLWDFERNSNISQKICETWQRCFQLILQSNSPVRVQFYNTQITDYLRMITINWFHCCFSYAVSVLSRFSIQSAAKLNCNNLTVDSIYIIRFFHINTHL